MMASARVTKVKPSDVSQVPKRENADTMKARYLSRMRNNRPDRNRLINTVNVSRNDPFSVSPIGSARQNVKNQLQGKFSESLGDDTVTTRIIQQVLE